MTDPNDPLVQLDGWGRRVERKARRGLHARAMMRLLKPGWPVIAVAAIGALFLTALTLRA